MEAGRPGLACDDGGGLACEFLEESEFRVAPHRGQNAADGTSSAEQRGQRSFVSGDEGCVVGEAGREEASGETGSVFPPEFCSASKMNGRSGCVLCGSIGRPDPVGGGCVEVGNAASTILRSFVNSATDW